MTLRLEDIAPLATASLFGDVRGRRVASRAAFSPTRRDFLRGAAAVGVGFGLSAVSLLPTAKPALADHGAWSIKPNCSGLGYAQDDDCDGCDLPGSPFCCCSGGFYDDSGCDKKHRPDECETGTGYDGWKWSTGQCCFFNCNPCCTCTVNREWRCSDGWKRNDCGVPYNATTDKRICRYVVSSGTICPGGCPC
jgi:hypothetical protein